jgi:four helix bundle protein
VKSFLLQLSTLHFLPFTFYSDRKEIVIMGEMKIERFEDLIAWQKARSLTAKIYPATNQGNFARDFGLRDQIRRAVVSVMSNIAEGFERNRPAEFHRFLSIAKASCGEVRSQLYVAFDAGYLDQAGFSNLIRQAEEVSRVIEGLRASVGKKLGIT